MSKRNPPAGKKPDTKKASAEQPDAKKAEPKPERDLDAKVADWLNSQGYPLEMRVARTFYRRNYVVDQSRYYVADQGKPREIDVLASHTEQLWEGDAHHSDSAYFDVQAVIECKASPKQALPWIVFTAPTNAVDRTYEETIGYHLITDVGKRALDVEIVGAERAKVNKHRLLMVGERLGHGIRCANIHNEKDNADVAYDAVCGLIDAAHASVMDDDPEDPWVQITLPVLVVSTPLYECWLDQDGAQRLERRNYIKLLWRRPSGQRTVRVMVHVLHEDGVNEFADSLIDLVEMVTTQYKSELIMAVQFAIAEHRKKRQ